MTTLALNTRLANFASWIRPDPDKAEDTREQRDEVRDRIRGKAESDGLTVRSTPGSGSFATSTGLRRHMLGGAEHEGQDIDCPFVLSQTDDDGDPLDELLGRFEGYAKSSYPDTPRVRTKSSVRLSFVASKRNFDLVPMLAVSGKDDEQVLLRAGGERRRTSVQKHVEFVKRRTTDCQGLKTCVSFNDMVRLVKWWREFHLSQNALIDDVPSFLILLLCAKAFDQTGVRATWTDTLYAWFDYVQSCAARRTDITFSDYTTARPERITAKWKVIDPVNPENNAVPTTWTGIAIDELTDWARDARDKLQMASAYDMRGREAEAVDTLCGVFGPSFANHSEE